MSSRLSTQIVQRPITNLLIANSVERFETSSSVGVPHSVDMWSSASSAAISRSLTTLAETGIARNARPQQERSGRKRGRLSCCRSSTFT